MNRQILEALLTVRQQNDYTWIAFLPEMRSMWKTGYSEKEARDNWLRDYDQPALYPVFTSLLSERAMRPLVFEEAQEPIPRPETVDFPYRGKLYRMATNEGPPKRHIVLPDRTLLVVCGWTGRIPKTLADIRRLPESHAPETLVRELDGVLAEEIPLAPGQTTRPMAILDCENQRYAVDQSSHAAVEMPDGRLYRIQETSLQEPVRITKIVPIGHDQLGPSGKTPAIPMAAGYAGMAHEPRDLRIRFDLHGERFLLSHEAYEQRKWIVFVPDYGFYRIGIYLESMPIRLGGLSPLPDTHYDPNTVAVALRCAEAIDS